MFHAHLIALSARVQPTVPSAKVNILFKMVPVLEIQKELAKLLKSMELLSRFEKSNIFLGKEATRNNFFKHLSDYEIIHLNTHAGLDSVNQEPWIAFEKENVTLNGETLKSKALKPHGF